MTDFMAVISDFLTGLEPRERLFLKLGSAVLTLVFLVLLLLPGWETYHQLKSQKEALETDMLWLQEKRELVAELVNNCPKVRQREDNDKADIIKLVRRNQLEVQTTVEKEHLISLTITGSKSNQFLKLMHQIACRGFILGKVVLNAEDDDLSKIKATFEVKRVN